MAGQNAFGAELARGDGAATEVFTAVANVTAISDTPNISVDALNATAHDSPDGFREYDPGLGDAGEMTATVRWVAAEHQQLFDDAVSKTVSNWRLTWADGDSMSFRAFVSALTASAPHDGMQEAEITFQGTGRPAMTVA